MAIHGCNNAPRFWTDLYNHSCAFYEDMGWCSFNQTMIGAPVPGVYPDNISTAAFHTCCVCGGGDRPEALRSSLITYFCVYAIAIVFWRTMRPLGTREVDVHTAAINYLSFLDINRMVFMVLTVISFLQAGGNIEMMSLGLLHVYAYSADDIKVEWIFTNQCLIVVKGIVLLLGVETWIFCTQSVVKDPYTDVLSRTLFFSAIPTQDKQRATLCNNAAFKCKSADVTRVEADLEHALNDTYSNRQVQSQDARSQSAQSRYAQSRSHAATTHFRDITAHLISERKTMNFWTGEIPKFAPEHTIVERIFVPYKIAEWHALALQLEGAKERCEKYERLTEARAEKGSQLSRKELSAHEQAEINLSAISQRIQDWAKAPKELAGSAVVTFKTKASRDVILGEKDCLGRGHNFFTFGHAPFSSVTLKMQRCPHPSNIVWESLHVKTRSRNLRAVFHVILLFVVMVLVISPVTIASSALLLAKQATEHAEKFGTSAYRQVSDEHFPSAVAWAKGPLLYVLSFLKKGTGENIIMKESDEFSTLFFLLINTLILPYWIYFISSWVKPRRHSDEELFQLHLNFVFLLLTSLIIPCIGVTGVKSIVQWFALKFQNRSLGDARGVVADILYQFMWGSPPTILQYLLSATFVTSGTQLMAIPQRIYQCFALRFAETQREIDDIKAPWPFAWGYWYAWALCNIAIALFLSEVVPSAMPCMVIFFTLRHFADKQNLKTEVYSQGFESEGLYMLRVVFYMRLIVCAWLMIMACMFLYQLDEGQEGMFSRDRFEEAQSRGQTVATYDVCLWTGRVMFWLPLCCGFLFTVSFWLSLQNKAFDSDTMITGVLPPLLKRTVAWLAPKHVRYVVSGASERAELNGVYSSCGTLNGKPLYYNKSQCHMWCGSDHKWRLGGSRQAEDITMGQRSTISFQAKKPRKILIDSEADYMAEKEEAHHGLVYLEKWHAPNNEKDEIRVKPLGTSEASIKPVVVARNQWPVVLSINDKVHFMWGFKDNTTALTHLRSVLSETEKEYDDGVLRPSSFEAAMGRLIEPLGHDKPEFERPIFTIKGVTKCGYVSLEMGEEDNSKIMFEDFRDQGVIDKLKEWTFPMSCVYMLATVVGTPVHELQAKHRKSVTQDTIP